MNHIKTITLLSFLLLFIGCSSKTPLYNTPVLDANYKKNNIGKTKDKLTLVLTFSGGGTRAAAFSYGVLQGLKHTEVNGDDLLSKVDIISSVSGGSFTSAYYGLYGDRIFLDFQEKFLKKDIQSLIIDMFTNPFNWPDLFKRTDVIAKYYEEEIFGEKTFKDFRSDSPTIIINATDLSTGNAFSFTKDNFIRICSNINTYPVGQAVAASSAVPVLFTPVILKNYTGCKELKEHTKEISQKYKSRNDLQALKMRKYNENKESIKYLHLIDGGIADNLGIRPLIQSLSEFDNNIIDLLEYHNMKDTTKMAFIVVNAADALSPKIGKNEESLDIGNVMGAVSTIQLSRYNTDTLDMVERNFKKWEKQINNYRCSKDKKNCEKIKFYLIELNFKQLPEIQAKKFSLIKTSLELPPEQVDALIQAGHTLLQSSSKFKSFVKDLETSQK